ncbi:hypothetical protein V8E51_000184 [Hyaloscypha variabilis]
MCFISVPSFPKQFVAAARNKNRMIWRHEPISGVKVISETKRALAVLQTSTVSQPSRKVGNRTILSDGDVRAIKQSSYLIPRVRNLLLLCFGGFWSFRVRSIFGRLRASCFYFPSRRFDFSPEETTFFTMPALDLRTIQSLGEASVILRRSLPTHEIVEAFLVVFVSVFGVGGAIVYAIKKC